MAGNIYYDDMAGTIVTAVSGATTWSNYYLRGGIASSNLPACPHIYGGDVFGMTFQMTHRKALYQPIRSVHMHWMPAGTAASNGANAPADGTYNIRINFAWGWFNRWDTIPTTLPNATGSPVDIPITVGGASDMMWKLQINGLISNLAAPANEGYSSILLVRCSRESGGADTYPGGLALLSMDAHIPIDRQGSVYEYSDYPPGTL